MQPSRWEIWCVVATTAVAIYDFDRRHAGGEQALNHSVHVVDEILLTGSILRSELALRHRQAIYPADAFHVVRE